MRREDVSGVSGTGVVAVGCVYPSGRVVIEWREPYRSMGIYGGIDQVDAIHGHDGGTEVAWDEP